MNIPDNLPAGLRNKDLEDDLHRVPVNDSTAQAQAEDDAYDKKAESDLWS